MAKINSDWLIHLEPISTLLKYNDIYSYKLATFLSYTGLAFDLSIGFYTRKFAAIGVVIFNISNHFLFDDINVFPFFMLASLVLFFDCSKLKLAFSNPEKLPQNTSKVKPVLIFISIYFLFS